ncbi:MAG: diguanylate cyclase [Alphaproteobacteria bacterium]|nr:diguanylate cyclase [Alphaproteobacteria bacterium]
MAVNYVQTLSSDMIVAEIESLVVWYAQILRHCFYSESLTSPVEIQPPVVLSEWCQQQAEKDEFDKKAADHLILVYNGLHEAARDCVSVLPPLPDKFDLLTYNMEAYVTQLRRLQQDLVNAGMTVDTVTGLRTVSGMLDDMKREQDRFNRKGTSFSVANIEIDRLSELQVKYDRRNLDFIFAHLAQNIAKTVRSFDDAYYLGKGEYLVVLKHVEFMDACAVMDRLRNSIEITSVMLDKGEEVSITASFGVVEAVQKESVDLMLEHAKSALQKAKQAGGNRIHEFSEQSAFDVFVKDSLKE